MKNISFESNFSYCLANVSSEIDNLVHQFIYKLSRQFMFNSEVVCKWLVGPNNEEKIIQNSLQEPQRSDKNTRKGGK